MYGVDRLALHMMGLVVTRDNHLNGVGKGLHKAKAEQGVVLQVKESHYWVHLHVYISCGEHTGHKGQSLPVH